MSSQADNLFGLISLRGSRSRLICRDDGVSHRIAFDSGARSGAQVFCSLSTGLAIGPIRSDGQVAGGADANLDGPHATLSEPNGALDGVDPRCVRANCGQLSRPIVWLVRRSARGWLA